MGYQYECPKCGGHRFDVTVDNVATVTFTDDDEHVVEDISHNAEWDDDSCATCDNCQHQDFLKNLEPK